jgi:hypothetical protein
MSVKRQLSPYSGMRFDIPHLQSIESSISYDFDALLQGLITGINQPYLIRGMDIVIPAASINASALEIKVADSAILHAGATEAGTILLTPTTATNEVLNSQNSKVIGAFQNGVINYLSLSYTRYVDPLTVDQTAGWSEAQKTEYQRTAPLGRVLDYQFNISTSGFGNNLPLYIVSTTSTGAVAYITKATPNLFRLGRGGSNPNPQYAYDFKYSNSQNPSSPRTEWVNSGATATSNPVTVIPGDSSEAFNYGDFAITSFKEWMDAVMTRIREVTGSSYWYTDSSLLAKSPNLFDVWYDSIGSVMTGTGYMSYNLILEATTPSYGAFQSAFTDSAIGVGDSYVEGQTSGNKATISSYNLTQLIVNSLVKQNFNFDEVLYNRRLFRPNLALSTLDDGVIGSNRVAIWKAIPQSIGALTTVTSWSYTVVGSIATITLTVASHTLKPGDSISVSGLNCSTNQPNGGSVVKNTTATTIIFDTALIPTGTATVSSAKVAPCILNKHPYLANFSITAWSYLSTAITLVAPNHSFITGQEILVAGVHAAVNGTHVITVNPDTTISFTVGTAPTGSATVTSASKVQLRSTTFAMTVTGSTPIDYNTDNATITTVDGSELLYVLGSSALPALPAAAGAIKFDGIVAISTVANPILISSIAYGTTPIVLSGSSLISNDVLTVSSTTSIVPTMVVSGTGIAPSTTVLSILSPTTIKISSPALLTGSASFSFASPYIEITCASAHGYQTIVGPIAFTIYGNQNDSAYITTYSQVSLINISANVFRLVGASIFNNGTYTNSGDPTYARYPSNPYPGPVQWTSDIIVKAIVGEKYVRIAQTATATGTDVANKFNINGQTGTVYLQDGEVAYILLERNKSIALGSNYSTAGGSSAIIGSAPFADDNGIMLRVGDFVKFADEDEQKWFRISSQGYPSLVEGDSLPAGSSIIYLITDNGQSPTLANRPAKSGKMLYSRGTYDTIIAKKHVDVDSTPDIYWLAVRRDNGSLQSKVYLQALELQPGEVRAINDNEPSNLLVYTGAGTEAAVNPNYTAIDSSGEYQATEILTVGSFSNNVDSRTRMVTFANSPALGFQAGDKITKTVGAVVHTYTIESLTNSITVTMKEDVSALSPSDNVKYYRLDYTINDSDNLTLAIRKEDRELARINTALTRPIYDESVYPVLITLTANSLAPTSNVADTDPLNADQIIAGSYIYLGTDSNNPSALGWVLHGTKTLSQRIESSLIGMPGSKFTETKILVHIISGTFTHGSVILQPGRTGITRQIVNAGNPAFPSTVLNGASNIELVLPPNRRTQVVGSSYITWPTHSAYKASQDPSLSGEDLMVIANDTIRESSIDYIETFGGPKAKIQIVRTLPINTRLRFRILPAYGSALSKLAGNVTLQIAYDGGNQIDTLTGRPVYVKSLSRDIAIKLDGKLEIDALIGGVPTPGILPASDKAFDIGTEDLKPNITWTAYSSIKTHNSHPLSAFQTLTFAGTSVGNSGSVLSGANITIPLNYALHVKMTLIARRSDGTLGVIGFTSTATYYRDGSGINAAGAPYTLSSGSGGEGGIYSALFGIVGNDIVPVVYGNGVVEWAGTLEYQLVSMPA